MTALSCSWKASSWRRERMRSLWKRARSTSRFTNPNVPPLPMKYALNKPNGEKKNGGLGALKSLLPFLAQEKRDFLIALVAILLNSGATLLAPIVIGYAVDHYIQGHDFGGVLRS